MGPTPPNLINTCKKVSGQGLIGYLEAAENACLLEHYEMRPDSTKDEDGGRIVHAFSTLQVNPPGLYAPLIFKKVSGQGLITGAATSDETSAQGFEAAVDPFMDLARCHEKGDIMGNTISDQKHRGGIL